MIRPWLEFARNIRGNVTLMASLAAIPVLLAATGAMEMMSISSTRSRLQAAVDAAALAGAEKLSVVTQSTLPMVTQAAQTAGADNMTGTADPASFAVDIDQVKNAVTVNGTVQHKALIGFLGIGDTAVTATATADALQKTPLCILQVDSGGIDLSNSSNIRAPGCLIHADTDITVAPQAMITATHVQASGTVTGPTDPQGNNGALPISDPFGGMNLNPTSACSLSVNAGVGLGAISNVVPILNDTTVAPGVHCLPILAVGNAHIHLLPGDHYFMGGLVMTQNSTIDGDDVAMIFGPAQVFSFADKATVRLTARKSGPFAGFLIATTRQNTNTFKISSGNVSELLGTIYIPNATLEVTSSGAVAQDSDWSVIVAKHLSLSNSPTLVINTNYAGSGVPVPDGVGPMSGTVLSR